MKLIASVTARHHVPLLKKMFESAADGKLTEARRMNETAELEVYTDGQCPLCLWMRARVEPFDRERKIEWLDLNAPDSLRRAAPYTYAELAEEMYVRRKADGAWSKGFYAWIAVLNVLPRLRPLGWLFARQPFTTIGPVFYRQLAKRRYQLFGIPPPCDASGVCQLHKKG